ncbi:MAG TPA: amidohydrolase family protein [Spirochaetota bacterium]|nr:amidohydrolase family protein [Spirochaetota bacterium]
MLLLKNGFIVDGTGKAGYSGSLLMDGKRIAEVAHGEIEADCESIDCGGRVISPGFIDMHSHNDWFLVSPDSPEFITPFLEQGITTFVGGNCGFGASGFKKGTAHRGLLENNLFKAGHRGISWNSLGEYYDHIERAGMRTNLVSLCGHGTTRVSIKGYDPSPMTRAEMDEALGLIDESMDQGARGVSFGMGYAPDIFTTPAEQEEVARLVKSRDGILAVHVRAFSSVSGAYPLKPFGEPHNLKALREFLDLARKTGVRLQISHLIFVGARTWKTLERTLALIDRAIDDGLDVRFDTYAHYCGATVITGILPEWFMAEVPAAYDNPKLLKKTRMLMKISFALLGFNTADMQLASANHPDLDRFNGMFLADIAAERKMTHFDNYIDIARQSDSTARMLLHKYSNPKIIEELMKHRASHFMTDAWVEPSGLQNPAAFGCFPRFLQLARERKLLSLEDAVHRMTGKNAERMRIPERGLLLKGYAADITVFDRGSVRDNTTTVDPAARPGGIDMVFVNGKSVVKGGRADPSVMAGEAIR